MYSSNENFPEPISQKTINKPNTTIESHNSEFTKVKPLRRLAKNTATNRMGTCEAHASRVRQPSEINKPPIK